MDTLTTHLLTTHSSGDEHLALPPQFLQMDELDDVFGKKQEEIAQVWSNIP